MEPPEFDGWLVVGRSLNAAGGFELLCPVAQENAGVVGAQAASRRPGAQTFNGFSRCDCYRDDVLGRLMQRDIEERSQATARFHLSAGP
jgi:hypothetical protein